MSDELVYNALSQSNNNTLPVLAFLAAFNDSPTFWNILQFDAMNKMLQVGKANLILDYYRNETLEEISEQLFQIDTRLFQIGNQLEEFKNIVAKKIEKSEKEDFARELIFNLNKFDKELDNKDDKIFVSFMAKNALDLVRANKVSTKTFSQITDKEYFSSVTENLTNKFNFISENEKKINEGFETLYHYSLDLIENLKKTKNDEFNIEVLNFPTELETKYKPYHSEILNIEEDLYREAANEYLEFSIFSQEIKKHIDSADQIEKLASHFFDAKKNYIEQNEKYLFLSKLENYKELSERNAKELNEKISVCKTSIEKFLALHTDFLEEYPRLKIPESLLAQKETKIIDYNEEQKNYEENLQHKLDELEKEKQKIDELLSAKMEKIFSEIRSKKNKFNLNDLLKIPNPFVRVK